MKRVCLLLFSVLLVFLPACQQAAPSGAQGPECVTDADCVPAACCHADECVPVGRAPACEGVFCTAVCEPGTVDCGGGCLCQEGTCVVNSVV